VRESGSVLAAGLIVGLAGAMATARILEHQMFGVQTFDLAILSATSALLTATWLAAMWWPARRASQKDLALSLKDV
jgi:ABC-type antimicrobial peptide transport system permease subunit